MSIQSYYDGADQLEQACGSTDFTRISPSSVSKFFTSTRQWYGETLMGEKGFEGSTSTILGSIIHYFAEQAALRNKVNSDKLVQEYLDKQTIDYDRYEVESLWKSMSQILIDSCVLNTKFHSVEQFIYHEILPGIFAAGTYDGLVDLGNGTYSVRDYKSSATKPSGIPYNYRMQAHVYAWILVQKGFKISQIELQYITKPTKTLPSRHFSFKEPFTIEDYEKIDGQLKLIAHSIKTWKEQPELRYLLAQDWRLYEKPKPKLFK